MLESYDKIIGENLQHCWSEREELLLEVPVLHDAKCPKRTVIPPTATKATQVKSGSFIASLLILSHIIKK